MSREERGALFDDTDFRHFLTGALLTRHVETQRGCSGVALRVLARGGTQAGCGAVRGLQTGMCAWPELSNCGDRSVRNFNMMMSVAIVDHESAYGDRGGGHHRAS